MMENNLLTFQILLSGIPLWAKFVNFAIFAGVLGGILYKPLSQGLQARAQSIQDDIHRSTIEKTEAEAKLKELEHRISFLSKEIDEIKIKAEQDAKMEKERILQTAQEDAERLRTMAQLEIKGTIKAAQNELKTYVAERVIELAETVIRREISVQDKEQLLSHYIENLEQIN